MIFLSDELEKSMVSMADILREPQAYPADVVEAFKQLKDHPESFTYMTAYRIEGYVLDGYGKVGIRPDSPEHIKKEWMKYWNAIRKNPYA